ncbi:hypothetical protein SAMN05444266_1112 [Chitinophaga jiangningensis]|uniref:Uncharacterized protein n=1 Tax=Chitinophaga jiangningensis TaxID=1419482 RepID=A0A1M7LKF5_9BACT|nr:hypothetical protein [Chitinophaga jiangningensis]SHM78134.1 hypothetical protein SAMN05444266_1112 [Chitinophaga jiangningensis]
MKSVFTLIVIMAALPALAQQLPDIQQASRWATNKKIDGAIEDWGTSLEAYNTTNKLWYSVANDNDFIYFAFKKTDNLSKIYAPASIQLSIGNKGERKTEVMPLLHFPVTTEGIHKKLPEKWDEIEVRNIPAVKDTLISIYNQYGIKAAWKLDEANKIFTCEIRIPRKLLSLNEHAFDYDICLMGTGRRGQSSMFLMPGIQIKNKDGANVSPAELMRLAETNTVTEFWATYELAQQP